MPRALSMAYSEPTGPTRVDGKRRNRLTLIPWQDGKPLTSAHTCRLLFPCFKPSEPAVPQNLLSCCLTEEGEVFLSSTESSFPVNCAPDSGPVGFICTWLSWRSGSTAECTNCMEMFAKHFSCCDPTLQLSFHL